MLELIRTGHEAMNSVTDYDTSDAPPTPCNELLTELGELLASKRPRDLWMWLESTVKEYVGYLQTNLAEDSGVDRGDAFSVVSQWMHILYDDWDSFDLATKASLFATRMSDIPFRSQEMDIVYGGNIDMTFAEFQASGQVLTAVPPPGGYSHENNISATGPM